MKLVFCLRFRPAMIELSKKKSLRMHAGAQLPRARRARPAQRAEGVRHDRARGRRHPDLRLQRRHPVPLFSSGFPAAVI